MEDSEGAQVAEIGKPDLVFEDGVSYDPARLLESVRRQYGLYERPARVRRAGHVAEPRLSPGPR